jgi:hypothetical protein
MRPQLTALFILTVSTSNIYGQKQPPNQPTAAVSPLANNGAPNCIGMFLNTTGLVCSSLSQSVYQGNPSVSIGLPATNYGALTLVGNVPNGDAAGMALHNAGGGAGESVSLDMYNTPFNGGIPQAKIKAIDDGAYSDHLTFSTKTPGAGSNPVAERVRIGWILSGNPVSLAGPLKFQ